MKKPLSRALAEMSLADEEPYWDEKEISAGMDGYEDGAPAAEGKDVKAHEANENAEVCAICLNAIELEELATIKGCEHEYCVKCILQWAACKETPWCPKCKKTFNYLYCHRLLDGTLTDMPVEESVCLLKRAPWFVEHVKTLEKGKAVSAAMAAEEIPGEWADLYDYDEEDMYDEDEMEKYYFSSAAGHARVVLGNRRLGENGYMRAGRVYARPANGADSGSGNGSGSIGKAAKSRTPIDKAGPCGGEGGFNGVSGKGHNSGSGSSVAGPFSAAGCSQGVKGQGRRAKRNARRAAVELEDM